MNSNTITERVYARIGLLGNPSDSYNGKTISLSLANFFAEVGPEERGTTHTALKDHFEFIVMCTELLHRSLAGCR